jgi:hypothetical protein
MNLAYPRAARSWNFDRASERSANGPTRTHTPTRFPAAFVSQVFEIVAPSRRNRSARRAAASTD